MKYPIDGENDEIFMGIREKMRILDLEMTKNVGSGQIHHFYPLVTNSLLLKMTIYS